MTAGGTGGWCTGSRRPRGGQSLPWRGLWPVVRADLQRSTWRSSPWGRCVGLESAHCTTVRLDNHVSLDRRSQSSFKMCATILGVRALGGASGKGALPRRNESYRGVARLRYGGAEWTTVSCGPCLRIWLECASLATPLRWPTSPAFGHGFVTNPKLVIRGRAWRRQGERLNAHRCRYGGGPHVDR